MSPRSFLLAVGRPGPVLDLWALVPQGFRLIGSRPGDRVQILASLDDFQRSAIYIVTLKHGDDWSPWPSKIEPHRYLRTYELPEGQDGCMTVEIVPKLTP